MFAIGTAPGYRLPFTTLVVDRVTFPHRHRSVTGYTWTEQLTMDIHLLAMSRDAIRPACNDNMKAA
ncbi:hypothetical protein FXV83_16135 [Bradyrhizobium hipponense]|uniref:Uncharacterized protein n=1 Tax=Bradyrhizobium hipponense TaxID=2605638 RepID=A0A5S4YN86_9BRAD|nr:hypothetical protein [Bradyrhizobium hipponense]TYO65463.1 hypothetical protein FXV83_16135 [Bradyrhizobium hipponense]